ncbi:MAG: hypothetical protein WAL16_01690 [Streptosporangiaceae bacterium]
MAASGAIACTISASNSARSWRMSVTSGLAGCGGTLANSISTTV